MVKMTALITLSFMIRNTSPVGWLPLLLHKIVYENAFRSFLIAGIIVALPLISFCITLDSLYYGEITITSYNFVKANLMEGLSKYYGVDPPHQYIVTYMLLFFTALYPISVYSMYNHLKVSKNKAITPYLLYFVGFYLLVFSLIPHKEYRFLTPIIPFCCLMMG
jgi:phosphatidylinositol glycan class B